MTYCLVFPPDHFVDDVGVRLDDLYDLRRDVQIGIIRHGDAVIAVFRHLNSGIDGLQKACLIDARENEAALVERLGALRGRADAHRGKGLADAREETALLGQSAAVRNHREGVHLQMVVVMEPERLMTDDPPVKHKPALFQTIAAARVAGIQDRHIVLFRHRIDGRKERKEVFLRVDILFAVRREQDILLGLQMKAL